ncbi:hypothetical protein MJO29_007884 [Puccinia striiformis f. sp. tritici]|nr:hypothetical protein MJO29_007884 [Puccinia striiformis f. sp. tritici]
MDLRKFKLLPTAERGIMLGYENDFSSYRIYKPSSRKAFRIRNVKFDETIFPGLKDHDPNPEEDVFETEETNDNVEVDAPVNSVELETHRPPTPVTSQPDDVESTLNEPGQNQGRKAPRDINSAISTDNILSHSSNTVPCHSLTAQHSKPGPSIPLQLKTQNASHPICIYE